MKTPADLTGSLEQVAAYAQEQRDQAYSSYQSIDWSKDRLEEKQAAWEYYGHVDDFYHAAVRMAARSTDFLALVGR